VSRTAPSPRRPPLRRVARAVKVHPRLVVAVIVGVVAAAVLPGDWQVATRFLVAWDAAIGVYVLLALQFIVRADVEDIRKHATEEDEGRIVILVVVALAALASLIAILAQIAIVRGDPNPKILTLAGATILLSWAFIHLVFALHYAHEFYDSDRKGKPALVFPGDDAPNYWDFLYFSFVIGMTAQVSDVAITDKGIRMTAMAHGIVSFLFNAALLALVVNIAAAAISK
jgi:uncharacterized membrane protein